MRRPPGSGGAGEPPGRARGAGAACPWDPRAGGVWRPRRLFLQLVGGVALPAGAPGRAGAAALCPSGVLARFGGQIDGPEHRQLHSRLGTWAHKVPDTERAQCLSALPIASTSSPQPRAGRAAGLLTPHFAVSGNAWWTTRSVWPHLRAVRHVPLGALGGPLREREPRRVPETPFSHTLSRGSPRRAPPGT